MKILAAVFLSLILLPVAFVQADIVTADFDDLTLDPESYYNGSVDADSFESEDVRFNNLYTYDDIYGPYWEGFAYSNTTDTTTLDYTNQYSAITGSGVDGSSIYGVGYEGTFYGTVPTVTFPEEVRVIQAYITNTTYAYLTIRDGYFNAKKFGGDSGDDPDWFLLTITGKDADGNVVGTIEFYLADFSSDDNTEDYIVDDWTPVDFTSMDKVKSLEFTMTSSDNDPVFGMNTPAYFAIDNIQYSDGKSSEGFLGCFVNNLGAELF
jgi:hypothetical protein